MNNHCYHHETLAAEHFKDLGRDMERERILAQLPRCSTIWQRGVGHMGRLLVVVGTRMQGEAQSDTQVAYNR